LQWGPRTNRRWHGCAASAPPCPTEERRSTGRRSARARPVPQHPLVRGRTGARRECEGVMARGRAVRGSVGSHVRVGGLFLIYTLYDQQPRRAAEPRAVVPLTEEQCPALDTLLAELRQPCPPPKRWRQTNQPAKHPNYARSGPCGRGRAAPTRGASDAFSTPRVATLPSPLRRRHADGFAALHALWAGYAFRPVESGANPL